MKKGIWNELQCSKYYHSKNIPFLISSKLLREIGAGQVDIAFLENKKPMRIQLIEVKSKSFPDHKQWKRLQKSQDYLSRILDCETILKVKFCQKDFDSLS
jgi:hypothetical protein